MRLLNSTTLELEDFNVDDIPAYAILSHTWAEDEVSFADMKNHNAKKRAGFKNACKQAAGNALRSGLIHAVDKSSSAELSETINSMYQWY